MVFLTPQQVAALARLQGKTVESYVVERTVTPGEVTIMVWGKEGKSRKYLVTADGHMTEEKGI